MFNEDDTKERRQATFDEFPWPRVYPTSQQLAEAGFIYKPETGMYDRVYCQTCELHLYD